MLNATQFQQWCLCLSLAPQTCEVIARLRSSPPARRVGSHAHNVSGAYASRKMGCTLQFESHQVELWAIYVMEHDKSVLEYYDQPTTLELQYPSKSGRKTKVQHTPDFLVLRNDGAVLEEWKPEDCLQELSITQPYRYQRDGLGYEHRATGREAIPGLIVRGVVRVQAALAIRLHPFTRGRTGSSHNPSQARPDATEASSQRSERLS